MLWFNGSIRNAIEKVKSSGVFLLVFVQGNDSLSEKYEAYLNEKATFQLDNYVAIKIPYDSLALQQFKQIYVSVPVPSVFLIQNNGIPLKVVSSSDTSEIHTAINEIVKSQKQELDQKHNMQSDDSLSNNVNRRNASTSAELSHVKNIGRKIFDINEDELKTRMKEIRAFPKFLLIDSLKSSDCTTTPVSSSKTQSARIQFRLPNNSMPSWEFPEMSTLGDVKAYLMEKTKLSPNFKLLRTYPRYAFTREDERKTLVALSLTPNAILIVVPYEDKTVQARVSDLVQQNFITTIISMLLKPLFNLLGYFKNQFLKKQTADKASDKFSQIKSFDRRLNRRVTRPNNIHGLKTDDSDTDGEHPDNGKSTQQRFQ